MEVSCRACLCRIRQLAEQAGLDPISRLSILLNCIAPIDRGDDRVNFETASFSLTFSHDKITNLRVAAHP